MSTEGGQGRTAEGYSDEVTEPGRRVTIYRLTQYDLGCTGSRVALVDLAVAHQLARYTRGDRGAGIDQ
jgi:hypothetical protein